MKCIAILSLALVFLTPIALPGQDSRPVKSRAHEKVPSTMTAKEARASRDKAVDWLVEATNEGKSFPASPIGLYFAKLWYFERLYPQVWSVAALQSLQARVTARTSRPDPSAESASS